MKQVALALFLTLIITGCASMSAANTAAEMLNSCTLSYELADPWEPLNRTIYRFNARFDEAILLPVARGYQRVLPSPIRTGINNFFSNLGELRNFVNHTLQGRPGRSLNSLGRFAINTTLGIGGIFDPATPIGLNPRPAGFGDTLMRWGTAPGPYLVLPLAGPSTLRDSGGLLLDSVLVYQADLGGLYQSDNAWALGATSAIDIRANTDFRYYASGSPFEYEMVRFLYSNKRMIESGTSLPDLSECRPPAHRE